MKSDCDTYDSADIHEIDFNLFSHEAFYERPPTKPNANIPTAKLLKNAAVSFVFSFR